MGEVDSPSESKQAKLPIIGTIYVCEKQGNNVDGQGTEKMPFQTLVKAVSTIGGETKQYEIYLRKEILENYQLAPKAALKKAVNTFKADQKKAEKAAERSQKDKEEAEKNKASMEAKLESAKALKLVQDPSLPKAKFIKLRDSTSNRDVRVKVSGWVHRTRTQGKDMMFVVVRDGYGFIQCVMTGSLCHTYEALTLSRETTISVYGTIKVLPEGKSVRYNLKLGSRRS
jgi:asparaginyl-tRNA synthetase